MDSHVAQTSEVHAFASQYMQVSQIQAVTADASFRSYWRVYPDVGNPCIVMHSPIDLVDVKPFVTIGQWLYSEGIPVPEIYQEDKSHCFLLLEDLGDLSLYSSLNQTQSIKTLEKPIDALVRMASLERVDFLPAFEKATLVEETQLFDEWCLAKADLGASPGDFDELYNVLADSAWNQTQGFVHRDYHSMNIHFCDNKNYGVGIIDFQDALWGPQTYDLISLLLDRYITWDQELINNIIESYRLRIKSSVSTLEFRRQVLWLGLQRNIRILGVFNRLSLRDSKPIYMNYVARKAYYCQRVIEAYDELRRTAGQGLLDCFKKAGWCST